MPRLGSDLRITAHHSLWGSYNVFIWGYSFYTLIITRKYKQIVNKVKAIYKFINTRFTYLQVCIFYMYELAACSLIKK